MLHLLDDFLVHDAPTAYADRSIAVLALNHELNLVAILKTEV